MSKKSTSTTLPRPIDPSISGAPPPPERTWRNFLSEALDNFGTRSRSPSPSRRKRLPPTSYNTTRTRTTRPSNASLNGPNESIVPITSPSNHSWLADSSSGAFDDDDFHSLERSESPPTAPISASPESEEGEALQNEHTARRLQMETIALAAQAYAPHQLVPITIPQLNDSFSPKPTFSPSSAGASSTAADEEYFVQQCPDCERERAESSTVRCEWQHSTAAELKTLAKTVAFHSTGIPPAHRYAVWLAALDLHTDEARTAWTNYYTALLGHVTAVSVHASRDFNFSPPSSSATSTTSSHPPHPRASFTQIAFREILKDVERTLPNMSLFHIPNGSGQRSLQRLLLAFSIHRPLLGYCQGLNFLAASILLVFGGHSEALAFAVFCALLEQRLSYYTKSMIGCISDARVLRDMVGFYDVDLSNLFTKQNITVESFFSPWFLCFFLTSPLSLPNALRIWDIYFLFDESVLHATALELLEVHRNDFLEIRSGTHSVQNQHSSTHGSPLHPANRSSMSEDIMHILTKIIGTTTQMDRLIELVKLRISDESFKQSLSSLRRYHKHLLIQEHAHIPSSRLRRLERSTQLPADELQRLWSCFLEGEDDKWGCLVSGVINDLLQFRIAFAAAVFPVKPHPSSNHPQDLSPSHQVNESLRWKGCGIIAPVRPSHGCTVCVPPLPSSVHLPTGVNVLASCPKCTWQLGRVEPVLTPPASWISTQSVCTCQCPCQARGLNVQSPSSSATPSTSTTSASLTSSMQTSLSVFQRLFHFFDASSSHGPRGFLDFEGFVQCVAFFLRSDRVARLQGVFRMAGGGSEDDMNSGGSSASSDGIQRGRIYRIDFESFVASFEELYHGHSFVNIPRSAVSRSSMISTPSPVRVNSPGSKDHSTSPPSPSFRMLSSVASARMFVDMAFEKERASNTFDTDSDGDPIPSILTPSHTSSPHDSLSYESFASFILLHPLISAFFRLDTIVD